MTLMIHVRHRTVLKRHLTHLFLFRSKKDRLVVTIPESGRCTYRGTYAAFLLPTIDVAHPGDALV